MWLGGEICFFDVNTHKGHWTVGWSGWGVGGGVCRGVYLGLPRSQIR